MKLRVFYKGESLNEICIPFTVKTILKDALLNYSSIPKVTLPPRIDLKER